MTTNMLTNLEVLQFTKNNEFFYGGAQEMYQTKRQRVSGCGPTCSTNLFIYLSQTNEKAANFFSHDEVTYETVLDTMEDVWQYITPGMMGLNSTQLLVDGANAFAKEKDVPMQINRLEVPKNKEKRPSFIQAREFLNHQIDLGSPIMFLNLDNGKVGNLDKWHWVLIVGIHYSDDELVATLYDEGITKDINLKRWIETTKRDGGFVAFELY